MGIGESSPELRVTTWGSASVAAFFRFLDGALAVAIVAVTADPTALEARGVAGGATCGGDGSSAGDEAG